MDPRTLILLPKGDSCSHLLRFTSLHDRGKLVLEAHKTLSATSAENAKKFENVVNLLEKEIKPDV